tara:strand:+ start:13774 stop:14403 length:630 start_codon:yes stop_codon:yes gene_type:complete
MNECLNKKVVLIGNTSVGKSCIIHRKTRNQFSNYSEPTIGAAYSNIPINIDDKIINLNVWDTAGQERYKSLAPMYFRGARVAIIVFDITSKESFEGSKSWFNEIKRMSLKTNMFFLVGNKCDMNDYREVTTEEANMFAETNKLKYIETSAKSAYNIENLFYNIGKELILDDTENMKNYDSLNNIFFETKKIKHKEFCGYKLPELFCTII